MALTAPSIANIWGNTNTTSADMVNPGGILNTGFLPPPTVPDREHMNWILNYLHNAVRYFSARGVTDWTSSETQYVVGSVVSYLGVCYILYTATPAGTAPTVDTAHWKLLVPVPPGTLLARRTITATGSYAVTAGTVRARFRMVGAGGGAAGYFADAGPGVGGGPGGASGSWGEFETTVIPAANWAVTMGSAGAGGAAPGSPGAINAGGNGGSAVLSDGTNTFTCPGGSGGPASLIGGTAGAAPTAAPGGTIILASAGQAGGDGCWTDVANGTVASGGAGGSSPLGAGGSQRQISFPTYTGVAGRDGSGYGSGGGGPVSYSAAAGFKGGDGKGCWLLLEEWS